MKRRQLTESERTTITNGLRAAADKFDGYVAELMDGDYHSVGGISAGLTRVQQADALGRLAGQFEKQAKESRELADLIEGCEAIEITPGIESLYDIPEGCICMGDGLMGMKCEAGEHARLKSVARRA